MRTQREFLDSLAQLHRTSDPELQRQMWRQGIATLAAEAAVQRPVPLEGLDPQSVLRSIRTAIARGLVDDLDFVAPSRAAPALYELAAILPMGEERRQLGRRVAHYLHHGDAETFVALATQLAIGARRGLRGAGLRARLALALDLPIGRASGADALALALISRFDLAEEWLVEPSIGSLPSRRLAARLLERAAREAAQRSAQGDDSALAIFHRPYVREAWTRLLNDRESLVWRHVATARGLLSRNLTDLEDEITENLDPLLSPTEWRRAAASLAASIAVAPQEALPQALHLLEGRVMKRDPGVAGAMLLGLPRVAEVEPKAAEELCVALIRKGQLDAAESLLALVREQVGGEFGAWSCQMARAKVRDENLMEAEDDGLAALAQALDKELRPPEERAERLGLQGQLTAALLAFADENAQAAYQAAQDVLRGADEALERLEAIEISSRRGRIEAFLLLRELDQTLLETNTLSDLLMLGKRGEKKDAEPPLERFFSRLTIWLLRHESTPTTSPHVEHLTMRIHRLRTLLHAIDADGSMQGAASEKQRNRRLGASHILLRRVVEDQRSPLTRIVRATASRTFDAIVREEIGELSDVLLTIVDRLEDGDALRTMAEASMIPEAEKIYGGYADLIERTNADDSNTGTGIRASIDALYGLVKALPVATSPRVDALHEALLGFLNAIDSVRAARSLETLLADGNRHSKLSEFENATRLLHRLIVGAQRRLGNLIHTETSGVAAPAIRILDIAVERAYRGERDALGEALAGTIAALHDDLPTHIAEVAAQALVRLLSLPNAHSDYVPDRDSFRPAPPKESPLPKWLPPSRTLGGFYVIRALGQGAVGSVFVARRLEEKRDESAQQFALKVPEYGGSNARTLSQQEFLQLFRDEAGALLAIPQHNNLARLVTFDAGARPKPILVMELVEGPTLERLLETRALTMRQTFELLDGIAGGLEAMHRVGVGHLDLKPSNVILRKDVEQGGQLGEPVLVDFGLAGRKIRPGCATAGYGSPEIWGLIPERHEPTPMAADVYAFGSLAFEMITDEELAYSANDVGVITAHLEHDGDFEPLNRLRNQPQCRALGELLRMTLRQDPRKRPTIGEIRAQLQEIAGDFKDSQWPLTA